MNLWRIPIRAVVIMVLVLAVMEARAQNPFSNLLPWRRQQQQQKEKNSGDAPQTTQPDTVASRPFRLSKSKTEQQQAQQTQPAVKVPTEPKPLSPEADAQAIKATTLDELVDRAIDEALKRKMQAGVHTPWQVVHGIVGLRWDCKLRTENGDISAIEWIFDGQQYDGQPLWEVTPYGGRGHPFTRPWAFEGHPTQFLGYMTMADIPIDYQIQADKGVITVRDIINDAKMTVYDGPEITWTLWALAHYEDPDAQWVNAKGEPWSIERLVALQTKEQVTAAACGGCHGLFVLAYARNMYLSTGRPLTGVWLEADRKIKRYIEESHSLQNSDGSFSSNHFKGPGQSNDFLTRITTSGHQLEWLMIALSEDRLNEPWVRNGVKSLATDLLVNRRKPTDCGPYYHSVHSLVLYKQRTRPGTVDPKPTSVNNLADRRSGKKPDPNAKPGDDDIPVLALPDVLPADAQTAAKPEKQEVK